MAGTVAFFTASGEPVRTLNPYGDSYRGLVNVALAQGAQEPELVTAGGAGGHVRVTGLESGDNLVSFLAFDGRYQGAVSLAAGDLDGDDIGEILIGATTGAGHVKVFGGESFGESASFLDARGGPGGSTRVGIATTGGDQRISVTGTAGGKSSVRYYHLQDDGTVSSTSSPVPLHPGLSGFYSDTLGGFSMRVAAAPVGSGIVAVGSDAGSPARVVVYDAASQNKLREFNPFPGSGQGGVRVAVGDLNGDGVNDIVAGQTGGGSRVRVFSGASGTPLPGRLGAFEAFEDSDGVSLAVADVNGDGFADLILGSQGAGPARVQVLSGLDGGLLREWSFTNQDQGSGISVAAGDVTGDGRADILLGSGPGGGSRVRVLDGSNGAEIGNFFAFDPVESLPEGLQIASGDVNGDGFADIITAGGSGGSEVRVISGSDWSTLSSQHLLDGAGGGIRVGAVDLEGDGKAEILLGQGPGGSQVAAYSWGDGRLAASWAPWGANTQVGAYVAGSTHPSFRLLGYGSQPSVSISTTTPLVVEGDTVYLTLTLSGISSFPCGGYLSYGGTATNGTGVDYYWNTGFSISAGQTSTTISFPTYTDNLIEGDETIVVTISSGVYCTIGSPSAVTIRLTDLNFPSTTLPVESCSDPASLIQNAPGVAAGGNPVRTTGGVIGANGSIDVPLGGDLVGAICSAPVGDALSWSSQPGNSSADQYGNNVLSRARPYLVKDSTSRIGVIESASKTYVFDYSGGVYTARYYLQNTLTYSSGTGLYTLADTVGNKVEFYDFSTGLPSAQRGQVKRRTDAAGNVTDYAYDTNGKLTDYQQATTVGSTTTTESFAYTYLSSGTNSGKVDAVTFRRKVNSGSWETVRTAQYS